MRQGETGVVVWPLGLSSRWPAWNEKSPAGAHAAPRGHLGRTSPARHEPDLSLPEFSAHLPPGQAGRRSAAMALGLEISRSRKFSQSVTGEAPRANSSLEGGYPCSAIPWGRDASACGIPRIANNHGEDIPMSRFLRFTCTAILLCIAGPATSARADIIYNNLGPGGEFSQFGYALSGPNNISQGTEIDQATQFTVGSSSYLVTSISAGILVTGPLPYDGRGPINVVVTQDSGGLPGPRW